MQTLLTVAVFQTRFQVNSVSVCGLLTVDASKLGLSTVGVFQNSFPGKLWFCHGLSTVVAWKLGM